MSLYDFERKLFWVLSGFIALTIVFYLYIIQSTIVHIVERKTDETEIRSTASRVAELEARMTALGKAMDINLAKEMGYQEISTVGYVSRTPVLTMRD